MPHNFLKRIITSIILLFLLIFINFSNQYVFISSILILGMIICFEANNLFSKILNKKNSLKNTTLNAFNIKFIILNIITFCYIFFIFCNLSYEIHEIKGAIFFLYVLSICFFTDIGGYLFGKIIGGPKLSKISPNKTISGTIGSFFLSIFPLIIVLNIDLLDLALNSINIVFCLLISLTSQLGDLFISFIKRKANVKDTGKILPGHGGLLDRCDGIIFAVPFSYFLLKLI
jgi:phosphatidate cytidylyltransferase